MSRAPLAGLDKKRLRLWLALFFLALAVPTGILVRQAYSQLKWEAFHQHRVLAEELAARIDANLVRLVQAEEIRSFTDYAFLVIAGDPSANFLQRSPLSRYPVRTDLPGVIGYFQVDAEGVFSTPLLPPAIARSADYGVSGTERTQRLDLQERILLILSSNRLVQARKDDEAADKAVDMVSGEAPVSAGGRRRAQLSAKSRREADGDSAGFAAMSDAPAGLVSSQVAAQAAFDQLNEARVEGKQKKGRQKPGKLGRVEDLKLESRYPVQSMEAPQRRLNASAPAPLEKRSVRKERSALPEPMAAPPMREAEAFVVPQPSRIRIETFESEIDPFEFSQLDSGHFVLFRKVWRDGQRYIQGLLVDRQALIRGSIESAFRDAALSRMTELTVAYRGDVVSAFSGQVARGYLSSAEELTGALLYRTRLSAPLNDLELIFSIRRLPAGPGGTVITWVAGILMVVLCGGFYLMYRLGTGQIELARQQQDFVSAVSHELRTPLTSIRMYGEMLREGWASEDKKRTYYDYIYQESERLSRLIGNVLQLARMTRNDLKVDARPHTVCELTDGLRSKVSSLTERAGFGLNVRCAQEAAAAVVEVDGDFFSQILINLVDNAIKFSSRAQKKEIDIRCEVQRGTSVVFAVRDYGPGVPRDQIKKIFRLFYRSESELTRETVGTGIGLALVHQLALAMNGRVDVLNREPGAEFRLSLPVAAKVSAGSGDEKAS
jgi:two-component system, OmpR family, phosphate regulon sensor histidine kinase PhoR